MREVVQSIASVIRAVVWFPVTVVRGWLRIWGRVDNQLSREQKAAVRDGDDIEAAVWWAMRALWWLTNAMGWWAAVLYLCWARWPWQTIDRVVFTVFGSFVAVIIAGGLEACISCVIESGEGSGK